MQMNELLLLKDVERKVAGFRNAKSGHFDSLWSSTCLTRVVRLGR